MAGWHNVQPLVHPLAIQSIFSGSVLVAKVPLGNHVSGRNLGLRYEQIAGVHCHIIELVFDLNALLEVVQGKRCWSATVTAAVAKLVQTSSFVLLGIFFRLFNDLVPRFYQ